VAGVLIENAATGKETKSDGPRVSAVCAGASTRLADISSRPAQTLSQAEECGLTPKEVFRECPNCPDMVVVPAGEFLMGSSRNEIDNGLAAANEAPQHKVIINQPIAIGRFEVTRDQFAAFVIASGYKAADHCFTFEHNAPQDRANRSFLNPGYVQEGNHPAVCVSWADAEAYVAWLSRTTGRSYRLLSEAEFEYAARAGTTSRFGFGNDPGEICNIRKRRRSGGEDRGPAGRCALHDLPRRLSVHGPCRIARAKCVRSLRSHRQCLGMDRGLLLRRLRHRQGGQRGPRESDMLNADGAGRRLVQHRSIAASGGSRQSQCRCSP